MKVRILEKGKPPYKHRDDLWARLSLETESAEDAGVLEQLEQLDLLIPGSTRGSMVEVVVRFVPLCAPGQLD